MLLSRRSVLGTPDDEVWPGVTSLPDYKPTFPKWQPVSLQKSVPTLEPAGLDLMENLLVYLPSKRLSAKQALAHEYFADIDQETAQMC